MTAHLLSLTSPSPPSSLLAVPPAGTLPIRVSAPNIHSTPGFAQRQPQKTILLPSTPDPSPPSTVSRPVVSASRVWFHVRTESGCKRSPIWGADSCDTRIPGGRGADSLLKPGCHLGHWVHVLFEILNDYKEGAVLIHNLPYRFIL